MPPVDNQFSLYYPGVNGNPDHCFVDLEHVRAASPLKISFDMEANEWVIATLADMGDIADEESDDVGFGEVARLPAWREVTG